MKVEADKEPWRSAVTTALLLAAGRGVRLAPLTDRIPKAALPLLDVPLGAWALTDLADIGSRLFVNTSSHTGILEGTLLPFAPHAVFIREDPEPIGSAGTAAALQEQVSGALITRAADHLTDLRCADLFATHRRLGRPATVAVAPVLEGADFEIKEERATRFIDRRLVTDAPGAIWIGAAVFERDVLALIPAERPLDLGTALMGQLTRAGELAVHVHDGFQIDVGTPARYLRASSDLLYGRGPRPPVPHPGEIFQAAGGRAYVGPDAEVDDDALGPDSIVLRGARVPSGSSVTRGIVMPFESVPRGLAIRRGIWAAGHLVSAHK